MHVVIDNDKGRKWQYQANYTMGIYICLDFFRYIGDEPPDTEEKIRHYILLIRPNRADRRKVTPKPAVYFYTELHKGIREYVLKLCGQIFYRRKTGNEPVIFVPESLYVYP